MVDSTVSAFLSTKVYEVLYKGQKFGSSGRFIVRDVEDSPDTGYYGAIIEDSFTGEGILVNRGTIPSDLNDLVADVGIVVNGLPGGQLSSAQQFLNDYKQSPNAITIGSTVGHSLGGYLAQLMGITEDLNVTAIASPGAEGALLDLQSQGYSYQVSNFDRNKITVINDPRDPVGSFGQQLDGINYQSVDLSGEIDPAAAGLVRVLAFENYEALAVVSFPVGTVYVLGTTAASLAYHEAAAYQTVITNNQNAIANTIDGIRIASVDNGDIITSINKITIIDKASEADVTYYEHTDGNLYGLRDNPDGTKSLFYKDELGNDVTKSFDSFTNTTGLTIEETAVVIEFGYAKFEAEEAAAKKYYEENPDIINAAGFDSLPIGIQNKIIEIHQKGQAVLAQEQQHEEVVSGGFANDTLLGNDGGDGLGVGSENFGVDQLVYIIQNGSKEHQIGATLGLYAKVINEGVYDSINDTYTFNGAVVESVNNQHGGEAVKISFAGITQGYITKYSQGDFQQRVVETVGFDGRTNSAEITIADSLVSELYRGEAITISYPENYNFGQVGGIVGDLVGQQLSNGELAHDIIASAITRTAGSNIGEVLDFLATGGNDLSEALFDPIFGVNGTAQTRPDILDDFLSNLQKGVAGVISSKLVDELGDVIDIGGVGGEVFDVAAGTITTGVVNEVFGLLFNTLDAAVYTELLSGGLGFSDTIPDAFGNPVLGPDLKPITVGDYVQLQVFNALGSFAGGRLAGEVIEAENEMAAIFGAAGSALATAVATGSISTSAALQSFITFGAGAGPVGIAVGAFVGTVVGTAFGNLFGGDDDEPQAWAHAVYDHDDQEYRIGANYGSDGGDPAVAQSMAQQVIQGINDIIRISQGKLRSGGVAPKIQIGFEGNEFQVAIGGGNVKSFGTTADAIHYAAFKIMKDFDLVGGHMVVMRAWHNSDATNIYEWLEDIQVAEAFQNYLTNPTAILALMMNEPESELAQSWAAILQRAAELELHLPHEKDLEGGWGEILLAQGVSSEFIPDISGDTLILTDPVTGEGRVLHHIIGPGYEIVRIEGTDGDDIIEVIVDGPSISYVNGGAGDDTIEGSDQADVLVGGSGEDTINGHAGNDWLHGGAGNDTLDGGAGDDLVVGGEDNDYLIGDSENDHIYGNGGEDFLFGGEGQDFLFGGKGNDVLDGGEGQYDELFGGEGDDILYGGDYHWLTGGKGNDTFILEDGEYTSYIKISRGDGHDIIQGQSDHMNFIRLDPTISVNELFLQKNADDLIIYVLGEDQTITVKDYYAGFNVQPNIGLQAYYNNVRAHIGGHWRNGILSLVSNDNTVSEVPAGQFNVISESALIAGTSDAESSVIWQPGPDIGNNGFLLLGDQNDNFSVSTGSPPTIIYGGAGDDILWASNGNEHLYGDSGNDTLHMGMGDDVGVGGLGDDHIEGKRGDDTLYGGHGNDTILAGEDNDIIDGGAGDDIIDAGTGDDNIDGSYGNDIIDAGEGNDLAKGGKGDDQIDGGEGNDTLYGGLGNDTITGGSGIDTIFGDEDDDIINSGSGDDWISGGSGADIVDGGEGSDVVNVGEGDDILSYVYSENVGFEDSYDGGAGTDKLVLYLTVAEYAIPQIQREILRFQSTQIVAQNSTTLASAVFTFALLDLIVQNIEDLDVYVDGTLQSYNLNTVLGTEIDEILSGSSSEDVIIGQEGMDQIFGFEGDDDLRGGFGDDTIEGGLGSDIAYGDGGFDVLSGDEGDDYLFGGNGNDTVSGGQDNDYIEGNKGNDTVSGDGGIDTIFGNEGDDVLIGGEGNDLLFGGEGNDEYHFNIGDGEDIYTDISGENDRIRLGASIVLTDLRFFNDNGSNLLIEFINSPADSITIVDHFVAGSSHQIEKIIFDDLSEFDLTNLVLNNAPTPQDDDFTVNQGQILNGNLMANNGYGIDSDLDGDNIQVQAGVFATTQGGEITISGNGDFSYTVANTFSGSDSFVYTVLDDHGDSSTATVNITVSALPVINGTFGNNTIHGTSSSEFIYGHEGRDYLYAKEGDDFIYGGAGADKITGDEGDDYIEDDSNDGFVTGTVSGHNNWFLGGEGNDHMVGGAGRDVYFDGYGNATYNHMDDYGTTDDWYSYWISGDLVRVTDRGGFSDNQAIYNKILTFSNVIYERYTDTDLAIKNTDGRVNIVHTDTFTDLNNVTGVGVEEIYISGAWRNLKSTILNYSDVMITRGSDGDDVINGINIANRDDEIYAGAGDDILYGDDGMDTIYGEAGADTFGFRAATAYQDVDIVKDFSLSEGDKIDISDLLASYDPLSSAIGDFVQITDNGTDTTLSIDSDGGADSFVAIAILEGATGIGNVADLENSGALITSNSI